MIKLTLCLICSMFYLVNAQTFEWVNSYNTLAVTNPINIQTIIAVDNSGSPFSSHLVNSRLNYSQVHFGDYVIAKRNPSGELIRQDTIIGMGSINQMCLDSEGNLLGAGVLRDSIYFKGISLYTTAVNYEAFIFKMDPSGNLLWFKKVSEIISSANQECKLMPAENGNFWLSLSPHVGNSTLTKLNGSAEVLSQIIQTNVGHISSSAVDPSGNIWVTGASFDGNASFNGHNVVLPFTYTEYVVKYSSAGEFIWVQFIEDVTFDFFQIVCDNEGNAYLSGNLFTSRWFGNIQAQGPTWVYDFFITKLDADGNFIWLREVPNENTLGDATIGNGNFLSYSSDGFLYLTGFLRNTVNFGDGISITGYGSSDVLVLKYNTAGNLLWAKKAGSNLDESGSSVSPDNNGSVFLSGRLRDTAQFDTIAVNGIGVNTFIAKISDGIIPVELVSFTGVLIKDKVQLNWSTSTEKNNMGFEIERMDKNSKWSRIGFIIGKGTSAETNNYTFDDNILLPAKYSYRLKQIDYDGSFTYSGEVEVDASIPSVFQLYQNYPNPFNPTTKIKFSIAGDGNTGQFTTLKIFDVLGKELAVLVNEQKQPGVYEVEFDASELTSGIYFYRLDSGNYSSVKKLMVIK